MSKKNKKVAKAYGSNLRGGSYGSAIAKKAALAAERALGQAFGAAMARPGAERALGQAFGAAMSGAGKKAENMRSPRRKLSRAEKAARARVKGLYAKMGRAARLPGGKKRSKVGKKKATRRTAAPVQARQARRAGKKKVATVTADSVIKAAAQKAMQRWLCEGARRSGCGAGGSRVVTGKGSFKRIRPPRFMTGG